MRIEQNTDLLLLCNVILVMTALLLNRTIKSQRHRIIDTSFIGAF